jgi:hypothetical protein
MFEFLIATGKVGVIGISAVFFVVFLLAEPGKEISFWGIKFHKKYRIRNTMNWRRVPKRLPLEWQIVLRAFANLDEQYIHESRLYEETKRLNNFTELKTRDICSEMKKYGLIKYSGNYVVLTEKVLPLVNNLDEHKA